MLCFTCSLLLLILLLEQCRGCEITAFDPKGTWSCKGTESGTVFNEVELSLDEPDGWTDYDEKVRFCQPCGSIRLELTLFPLAEQSSEPVSVMEFESKIERA